ncbi:MAG: flavin reductase family protein [Candidatus Cloacimonetes bacterium]|nr:flavin reductase family protein [Candidatus Cloacimonadota bacterium]
MIRTEIQQVIEYVKNPVKIALAVVRDPNGKDNAITLEWYMRTSITPPMFAISVGLTRFSHYCLQNFRYFNLCFPSPEQIEAVKICGSKSGSDIDKFALCNFDIFPGKLAKLPVIRNAAANFECEMISQLRSGDHTIFTGEIKYAWYDNTKRVITYQDF